MNRNLLLFLGMGVLFALVGFFQSWSLSLTIFNMCVISAIMALGVNMQWGYAGLFNVGIMGFAALGGVAAVLTSMPPVGEAWSAGGTGIGVTILALGATIVAATFVRKYTPPAWKTIATVVTIIVGYFVIRSVFDPAVEAIEAVNPAKTGYLGGLGLPMIFAWVVGGVFAAIAAWIVGKISLGLRADYLAIATLGISEIIIAMLKNEDWLTRGVKNVTGLPRPVPLEIDLQKTDWFLSLAARFNLDPIPFSSIFVKISYGILFLIVLGVLLWLSERALKSPWGRMMRAIRDNRDAAEAMGKDVTRRHLQIFILGSAVVGIAGAMLTTLDGQFTPGTYNPLRFTFLIWVMVIVGGSGNNWGSVLGGFLIWFVWIQAETVGFAVMESLAAGAGEGISFVSHLKESAPHMRLVIMGAILLLVLRFSPKGLIPERTGR